MNSSIYQNIITEFKRLNFTEQLDLIKTIKHNQKLSAEVRAEMRLTDELNSDEWITTINENEDIDENELNNWLKNCGN